MSQLDNIYDRQIRTFGFDANNQIMSSSVLMYGLEQGLGTEIAKNLTLSGVKHLYLYDQHPIIKQDLKTGYYYSDKDIGQTRSLILMNKLQELGINTVIHSTDDYKQNQHVTIVINQSVEIVKEISDYCRLEKIKLIVVWSKGISGVIFVDAGDVYKVFDNTRQTIESVQIKSINESGQVNCITTHEFQTGDTITFSNLEGQNLKEFEKEWKINVINKDTFQLENFKVIDKFRFMNGTANYINKSFDINHNPFNISLSNELIKTYIQMYSNNLIDKMPELWTEKNDKFMSDYDITLPNHARLFHHEIAPIMSIFGSLVAFETIKLVSHKYIPISQWFTWTDESILPKDKPTNFEYKTTYGLFYG